MVPFLVGFRQEWNTHLLRMYIEMTACCAFSFFPFSLSLSLLSSLYLLALLPFVRGKSTQNMSLISSMSSSQASVVLMKIQAVRYDTLLTEAVQGLALQAVENPEIHCLLIYRIFMLSIDVKASVTKPEVNIFNLGCLLKNNNVLLKATSVKKGQFFHFPWQPHFHSLTCTNSCDFAGLLSNKASGREASTAETICTQCCG